MADSAPQRLTQRLSDRDGRDIQRREKRVDDSQPYNCRSHRLLPGVLVWNFRGQKAKHFC